MEKAIFSINGMSCGHCAAAVTKALKGLAGVSEADVDLRTKQATVVYDPAKVSPDALKDAVRDAGYQTA